MSLAGVLLMVFMIFGAGLIGLVIGTLACDSFPDWVPEEPESSREKAKRQIDKARAKARVFGFCDGKGECTSVLWHWTPLNDEVNVLGSRHCDDCGRLRA